MRGELYELYIDEYIKEAVPRMQRENAASLKRINQAYLQRWLRSGLLYANGR